MRPHDVSKVGSGFKNPNVGSSEVENRDISCPKNGSLLLPDKGMNLIVIDKIYLKKRMCTYIFLLNLQNL